jgi:O-antigen ligase
LGVAIWFVYQQENRSSILALIAFGVIILTGYAYKKRIILRILYIFAIGFNVGLPFYYTNIEKTNIFESINLWFGNWTGKEAGLNGREVLWDAAITRINNSPLFGSYGLRTTYYHNFSLDILTQFGWVGFILYIVIIVGIMEKCFEDGATNNIFLIGFLCTIFLNSFENVLFADNLFTIFPYMLIATAWSIKKSHKESD